MQGNLDPPILVCGVTLEWSNAQNSLIRTASFKSTTLRLIRNEFREIFIELYNAKENSVTKKFHLKSITVHKRFMTEGKASIKFNELNMLLMIFNAPPNNLVSFLKTMFIKLSDDSGGCKLSVRSKLLAAQTKTVEEISPVTLKELNNAKAKALKNDTTPTGIKRPLSDVKESKNIKRTRINYPIDSAPLTDEQNNILQAALAGKSIFFTGSAGTGKSYLLRRILGTLPPDVTIATASTGVAACHIGGITLHAFAGIGSGQAPIQRCIELASRPQVLQMWKKCKHLIIDEISMVEGEFFEKLEHVARVVRKNDRPFGGIQLILCGDFLQLPPVCKDIKPGQAKFCFQSKIWDKVIHTSYELNKVHRQADPVFVNILQNLRIGRVTPEISEKLLSTSKHNIEGNGILATRLCSHMMDADFINKSKMDELKGECRKFTATDSDPYASKQLDQQTPVSGTIELKIGAQVMLMKNLNISEGLVNGARGVVTRFSNDGMPVVRFCSKREYPIYSDKWIVKTAGGNTLTRRQIPLRLAWAFSIHKSQDRVQLLILLLNEWNQY